MRNAALVLGLIGGIIGIFVGLVGYGLAELNDRAEELGNMAPWMEDAQLVRMASFFAPLLVIAGGAMAKVRALIGGLLMLLGAAGFYIGFGFHVGTMFPIGMAVLGGVFALAAGKPDEPKSHF